MWNPVLFVNPFEKYYFLLFLYYNDGRMIRNNPVDVKMEEHYDGGAIERPGEEKRMCGRYYVDDDTAREIEKLIHQVDRRLHETGNGDIHPSENAVVLTGKKPSLSAETMKWGFPQRQGKGLLINARSETVLDKRMFRDSVLHRRCIIPAKYFYEWNRSKEKVSFFRENSPVIYMAGFYDCFQDEDRFIILTASANASVEPVLNIPKGKIVVFTPKCPSQF